MFIVMMIIAIRIVPNIKAIILLATIITPRMAILDDHESVHRNTIVKVTNKMQLYWFIYCY
jgi:hypothetical protein